MKKLFTLLALGMFSMLSYAQTDSVSVQNQLQNLEKTDQVLSKILEKSLAVAERTGDFVIEQAPELLHEFYLWHSAQAILWICISILIFFASIWIVKLSGRTKPRDSDDRKFFNRYFDSRSGELVAVVFIFSIITVITSTMLIFHLMDLLYIILSPRLYLIDYLINLRN